VSRSNKLLFLAPSWATFVSLHALSSDASQRQRQPESLLEYKCRRGQPAIVTLIEKDWLQPFPKIYDAEFHAQSAAAVASFEATRIAQLLGAEAKEKSSSVGARQRSQLQSDPRKTKGRSLPSIGLLWTSARKPSSPAKK